MKKEISLSRLGFTDPLVNEHRRVVFVLQVFAGLLQARNHTHRTLKGAFNRLGAILSSIR
jgi:hypothetical protein